jgi:transposase
MLRTHGYSPKGHRCYGSHNWGAKGRTNVIGAFCAGIFLTVSFFLTSIDTVIFTSWVKQDLLPTLFPRSVIILDNASFHKGKEMQQALEAAGHVLLYLPPYSPDLNPIERKWAQAKSIRRKQKCSIEELFKHHIL